MEVNEDNEDKQRLYNFARKAGLSTKTVDKMKYNMAPKEFHAFVKTAYTMHGKNYNIFQVEPKIIYEALQEGRELLESTLYRASGKDHNYGIQKKFCLSNKSYSLSLEEAVKFLRVKLMTVGVGTLFVFEGPKEGVLLGKYSSYSYDKDVLIKDGTLVEVRKIEFKPILNDLNGNSMIYREVTIAAVESYNPEIKTVISLETEI